MEKKPLCGIWLWVILSILTCWTLSADQFVHFITDGAHVLAICLAAICVVCIVWTVYSAQHTAESDDGQVAGMAILLAVCVYFVSFPVFHELMGMIAIGCAVVFITALGQVVEKCSRAIAQWLNPDFPEADPRLRGAISACGICVTIVGVIVVQRPDALGALGEIHRMPWQPLDYTPALQVAEPTASWAKKELTETWQNCSIFTAVWGMVSGGFQLAERLTTLC